MGIWTPSLSSGYKHHMGRNAKRFGDSPALVTTHNRVEHSSGVVLSTLLLFRLPPFMHTASLSLAGPLNPPLAFRPGPKPLSLGWCFSHPWVKRPLAACLICPWRHASPYTASVSNPTPPARPPPDTWAATVDEPASHGKACAGMRGLKAQARCSGGRQQGPSPLSLHW